jgi:hypothetical protein
LNRVLLAQIKVLGRRLKSLASVSFKVVTYVPKFGVKLLQLFYKVIAEAITLQHWMNLSRFKLEAY